MESKVRKLCITQGFKIESQGGGGGGLNEYLIIFKFVVELPHLDIT